MGLFSRKIKQDDVKEVARTTPVSDTPKTVESIKSKVQSTKEDKIKKDVTSSEALAKDEEVRLKETKKEIAKAPIIGSGKVYQVLLRPIVSEKATMINAANKYSFAVALNTNKSEIKKAVKQIYGVTPINVNIINQVGKTVRFRQKSGRTSNYKKAIVTLKKGDSIRIYEGT